MIPLQEARRCRDWTEADLGVRQLHGHMYCILSLDAVFRGTICLSYCVPGPSARVVLDEL